MYLHKLEKDEKTTFLAFARHLAHLDDKVLSDPEKYMLKYMAAEMGLSDDDAQVLGYAEEEMLTVFHRPLARRVLLLEAVGICFAGGGFKGEQRAHLAALAGKFQLPDSFIADAESIVKRQLGLMQDFDRLIAE